MTDANKDCIRSRIWLEEPEPDNPFAARAAYCHGYDVYGDMLDRARWVDMLYLLFRGEPPSRSEAELLEALAVALANPGPRDPSVHAAMCGGVGGSTAASCLIAALTVGAGQLSGGRELASAMELWHLCGVELSDWTKHLAAIPANPASVWPSPEHPPGFDPHGVRTALPVIQTLSLLAKLSPQSRLPWLEANRDRLEAAAGHPLTMSGVAAAAFADLGFAPAQAEIVYLLLRLPGAAAHAMEQHSYGHKQFPFYKIELENTPAALEQEGHQE